MARHDINQATLKALLTSPTGGVAKDMLKRGKRVEGQAKRNLAGANGAPKRINNGRLRSDIQAKPVTVSGAPAARIGTRLKYGRYVHDGTGLFGPRHERITPKTARALVFPSKKYGKKTGKFAGKVVVRSTAGMKPNQFLKDALKAARVQ